MGTRPEHADWLRKFYTRQIPTKLSRSALETIAIIAYRQPVTKSDVESIRGVNSDSVVNTLLAKGLVTISGRKRGPGRPLLYSTTEKFLYHFGLKNLSDLPSMEEMEEMFAEKEEQYE
jgi:segregation and condensation protein B